MLALIVALAQQQELRVASKHDNEWIPLPALPLLGDESTSYSNIILGSGINPSSIRRAVLRKGSLDALMRRQPVY